LGIVAETAYGGGLYLHCLQIKSMNQRCLNKFLMNIFRYFTGGIVSMAFLVQGERRHNGKLFRIRM